MLAAVKLEIWEEEDGGRGESFQKIWGDMIQPQSQPSWSSQAQRNPSLKKLLLLLTFLNP